MRIISTITEVDLDRSPQDIAYQLSGSGYLCFLDSSLSSDKYSRFSYIGWEPSFAIKSSGLKNEFINISKKINNFSYHHPLKYFKENLKNFIFHLEEDKRDNIKVLYIRGSSIDEIKLLARREDKSIPDFIGGFMGYFSYDLKDHIEELPHSTIDDIDIPIIYQNYYTKVLAWNHQKKQWYFIRNFIVCPSGSVQKPDNVQEDRTRELFEPVDLIDPGTKDMVIMERVKTDFKNFQGTLDEKKKDIYKDIIDKYLKDDNISIKLKSNMNKKEYLEGVKRTKEYIHDGDIYQVNFSQRFQSEAKIDPMDMYYILRKKNAAPFSAYLGFQEFYLK